MTVFWIVFGFAFIAVAVGIVIGRIVETYTRKVIVWDYQAGLHYKHGRFIEKIGAGKHRFWGSGHEVVFYDTRQAQLVVQGQEIMAADKAAVKVTAVAFYRIADPRKLIESAEDGIALFYTDMQLALRQVIGTETIDTILEDKAVFGDKLLALTRGAAAAKGLALERVEIRDVMLAGELKRVFAGVIHARKEAEASLEKARGEAAALRTMANAARLFQHNPELLQLKYLEVLGEAGQSAGSTLVMGLPEVVATQVRKK